MRLDLMALKRCLDKKPEVVAAYLFGSAATEESVVNDVDLLVLLRPDIDKYEAYFDIVSNLAKTLGISEDRIDLLLFDLGEADPIILYNAINRGVLLKNSDSNILGDMIDALSGYFLENEPIIMQA
ncbi:MAG: nucleotidyltransferase domain-containing protein [Deltaproteobacteria bacterium]|jgi:predicted nucleotidyltransferase|nr:nucleotidyltransferase domain-containing protein [Deltaproteobacteria bacterium]MBT6502648.1 nucleotidyltransferase domain-containing protein [Deltaproteobacteria bacterium]